MTVPSACIISLTPVTDEPRVIRQAGALLNKGWKVTVCGFKGRQAAPAGWRLIEVTHMPRRRGWLERQTLRSDLIASRASRRAARRFYWRHAGYDAIYEQIDFVEDTDDWDLVIGHDYYTAPLAARISERRGIPFSIDVHELAREQYMHDRRWVLLDRPWVHRLQKEFMPKAAAVTTICDGIAEALMKDYEFQRPPTVARSTALYQKIDFRADLNDLPLKDASVDLIFSEGVLHHTDDTERAFHNIARLLKPGGHFLLYVYRKKGPIREFTDDYIRAR